MNTYNATVRIRDMKRNVDEELGKIAARRGKYKWEAIREAIEEYVERHSNDANR